MNIIRATPEDVYCKIEKARKSVVVYSDFYSEARINEFINKITTDDYLDVIKNLEKELLSLTSKTFKPGFKSIGSLVYISLGNEPVLNGKIRIACKKGTLLIIGDYYRTKRTLTLPELGIKLYDQLYSSKIYLSIQDRLEYANSIKNLLKPIHDLPDWSQCVQKCLDLEIIGKGSYGNVYKSAIDCRNFAVKIAKLKPEAVKHPNDLSINSWHEEYYLRKVIKPLIEGKKCPNLPLLIDKFICSDCCITIDDVKIHTPSIITVVELADGDLKKYTATHRSDSELYSCLFQVMVALHAIQKHGQVMNFDVKKENILYYDVVPGGFWCYNVRGADYYVPNHGKLFVLNDFGISRPLSPAYPIFKNGIHRLGSRFGVVMNGKIEPIRSSGKKECIEKIVIDGKKVNGGEFLFFEGEESPYVNLKVKMDAEVIDFLNSKNIPCSPLESGFYENPEVIPPFEFYNDMQDALRMFVGGKRTTQKGNHKVIPSLSKKLKDELQPYLGKGANLKAGIFSSNPSCILAGHFIESFFGAFRKLPENGGIIEKYVI